jgi:sugar (pentulose or hexulose) kinase
MSYLVADCGTSGCKAALISEAGRVCGMARRPFAVRRPAPDAAEVDPAEVFAALCAAGREAAAGRRGRVRAVGVSAMLGWVLAGRDGRPLAPAPIWMDRRAAAAAAELERCVPAPALHAVTGRRAAPGLLAPILGWFRVHRPGILRRTRTAVGLKDELVRRLTGACATDFAHLDYTLLFDVERRRIDPGLAAAFGIEPGLFAAPGPATAVVGGLSPPGAAALGLPAGLPVVCGSSDGTSAMYGAGVLEEGTAVLVSGTTDVLMAAARRRPADRTLRLAVNTGMLPGLFLAGGATGLSGGAVDYLERLLSVTAVRLERRIRALAPGAGGLTLFPGLTGERAPFGCGAAAGGVAGLRPEHRPEHFLAAAMEGAAFRIARLLELMRRAGLAPERINLAGGAAASGAWNRIRCDAAGIPLRRPRVREATLLGTAMFCRAAVDGVGLEVSARQWLRFAPPLAPDRKRHAAYRELAAAFEARLDAAAEVERRLSADRRRAAAPAQTKTRSRS